MEHLQSVKTGLIPLQEKYPNLDSNELAKMIKLITDLENELMFMRTGYNQSITLYNTRIKSIPDVLLAILFGFKEKKLIAGTY